MTFNKIDISTWNRKESYEHYLKAVPCTYSMTINLDITNLMAGINKAGAKFFPVILYGITQSVNKHIEFRMDLDGTKSVGYYSYSNPCYTVFHNKTETFTNVWTEYNENIDIFLKNYDDDMGTYRDNPNLSKPLKGSNIFNVSCIPWISFTGFNLNLEKGYDYFPPIFTIGKFFNDNSKILLPLSVQVHHAVCDAFHLSLFLKTLQEWADEFKL